MFKHFFKIKEIALRNKVIFQNFSYISLLQVFILIIPLITYPYLVRVLGKELYGIVITAQVVVSYASILIDFGFKSVTARHISVHRNDFTKLSEIVNSVMVVRIVLCIAAFFIYMVIIFLVDYYSQHRLLFLLSFFLVFNELLFPQFYFQGTEKMKWISVINIIARLFFIILIFVFVKTQADYYLVPVLTSIGYLFGGIYSLYIIYYKDGLKFFIPSLAKIKFYVKDALPIFSTTVVASIKDKFSYLLLGSFVGISEVVVYDLGSKLTNILVRPVTTLGVVLFPKVAKEKNIDFLMPLLKYSFLFMILLIAFINIVLPKISILMLGTEVDLIPLRIFLFAPLFLALSSFISSNIIIALGYNKYVLYSILITTFVYSTLTLAAYFFNLLNSITTFVLITVLAYFTELIYRLYVARKIKMISK